MSLLRLAGRSLLSPFAFLPLSLSPLLSVSDSFSSAEFLLGHPYCHTHTGRAEELISPWSGNHILLSPHVSLERMGGRRRLCNRLGRRGVSNRLRGGGGGGGGMNRGTMILKKGLHQTA
jgi:hypothetical protein